MNYNNLQEIYFRNLNFFIIFMILRCLYKFVKNYKIKCQKFSWFETLISEIIYGLFMAAIWPISVTIIFLDIISCESSTL